MAAEEQGTFGALGARTRMKVRGQVIPPPGMGDIQRDKRPPLTAFEKEVSEKKRMAKKPVLKVKIPSPKGKHGKVVQYDKETINLMNLRGREDMGVKEKEPRRLRERIIKTLIDLPEIKFTPEDLYRAVIVKYYGVKREEAESLAIGETEEIGVSKNSFYTVTSWIKKHLSKPPCDLLEVEVKFDGMQDKYTFNSKLKQEIAGMSFNQLIDWVKAKKREAGIQEGVSAGRGKDTMLERALKIMRFAMETNPENRIIADITPEKITIESLPIKRVCRKN